jgi:hypothetical protein
MTPRSALKTCLDKEGLIEEIRLAINSVIALNNRVMEAVIEGSFAQIPALNSELAEARTRKDSLLDKYYNHVREHGC